MRPGQRPGTLSREPRIITAKLSDATHSRSAQWADEGRFEQGLRINAEAKFDPSVTPFWINRRTVDALMRKASIVLVLGERRRNGGVRDESPWSTPAHPHMPIGTGRMQLSPGKHLPDLGQENVPAKIALVFAVPEQVFKPIVDDMDQAPGEILDFELDFYADLFSSDEPVMRGEDPDGYGVLMDNDEDIQAVVRAELVRIDVKRRGNPRPMPMPRP